MAEPLAQSAIGLSFAANEAVTSHRRWSIRPVLPDPGTASENTYLPNKLDDRPAPKSCRLERGGQTGPPSTRRADIADDESYIGEDHPGRAFGAGRPPLRINAPSRRLGPAAFAAWRRRAIASRRSSRHATGSGLAVFESSRRHREAVPGSPMQRLIGGLSGPSRSRRRYVCHRS